MDESEWRTLWKTAVEIHHGYEPGAVFIGGVAVFAHTKDSKRSRYVAFSHDADFMISVADYTDLKDLEKVTPNRRLSKAQFYKGGFEFDVYVEGQNDLSVPYEEVAAHSEIRAGIRVASLEHLLILKLKASADRRGSAKGDKDEDDVAKILMLLAEREVSPERIARMDDEMVAELRRIARGDAPLRIASGNAHEAASLKKGVKLAVEKVESARQEALKLAW